MNENTIYQGILASNRYNPIFLMAINKILDTDSIDDYLIFTRQMYEIVETVKNDQDITLLKEICVTDGDKQKDKYGLYCKIINEITNDHVFDSRDHTYPW
jgi:hypothetical protein